ncbi:hypothetical protein LR003_01065 [candidate division NPL-UPA2 bacterium]|nr:hypothetical protein [candidate division NPL-UPA2 bacterium]
MKRLMVVWLILLLSLSLGNVIPVIAQEKLCECGCEEEGKRGRRPPGLEGRRRGRERLGFGAVTQEEEEKILRYLEENRPEEFERLTRLRERSPSEYRRILGRFGKRIRRRRFLEDLKKEDPERYEKVVHIKELERESRQLARKYREINDPEEREIIRANLNNLLSEIFDLRQEERETETKRLERELKRLREKIIRRWENKEAIVNRRLKEMTGEVDYLQW